MKKIILSAIIFFALTFSVKAQFTIGYSVGYGTYSMGEMKDGLKSLAKLYTKTGEYLFDMAVVENFPGYINHQLEAGYRLNHHEFGIKSMYMTTGGKVSRADYSGEVSRKLTMNGFKQELFYRYYFLNQDEDFNFYLDVAPGIIFNNLKAESDINLSVYDETLEYSETIKFNGINFAVTPSVGVSYNITSMIMLRLAAGYEINFTDANLKKNSHEWIYGNSNWSGLRISAGISLYFK